MSFEKMFLERNFPSWFELSWDSENVAIMFSFHESMINKLKDIDFGGVLVRRSDGDHEDFVAYRLSIPTMVYGTKTCSLCQGYGVIGFGAAEDVCIKCEGLQTVKRINRDVLFPIASVLSQFSWLFSKPQTTHSERTQTVMFSLLTINRSGGTMLNSAIAPKAVDWLRRYSQENTHIIEVVSAMQKLYGHLYGRDESENLTGYQAAVRKNGALHLTCPGDGCGLDPARGFPEGYSGNIGYHLIPHNVDRADQQLTLLAGLAALCDKIREE